MLEFISVFNLVISVMFFACYAYQLLYVIVPFIKKKRSHSGETGGSIAKNSRRHGQKDFGDDRALTEKIAVLICARNEETVIAGLIESLKAQTYPSGRVTVFVMADNCSDGTRSTARHRGAVVYTRDDTLRTGKGYALNLLISKVLEDYGKDRFDSFVVFDADNIVTPGFLSAISRKMQEGYDVVTSLRNSKNYSDSWVSARNALWFLRDSQYMNRSRDLLGVSCVVTGTGFAVSRSLLRRMGGWPFHLMSEDLEFTAYCVTNGIKVGYCEEAEFYDEQPVSFSQSIRQRLRWSKGYYQVFEKYGEKLAGRIIKKKEFSSYDLTVSVTAAAALTMISIMVWLITIAVRILKGDSMAVLGAELLGTILSGYGAFFLMGAVTTLAEWKKIHASAYRKLIYIFTFPVFMMTYIPIYISAMFIDVKWKPISHTRRRSLAEITKSD